ncbi:hypothetical protein QVD17_09922 [Tagetes erecta]|uniref:LHY n=1 Tax=Tagetes erecta TaxID=13708 RepID=A0AAD8L1V1_TARER|nr:hypothetical protein QVD17_09922 [Tagetes erecta]
MDSNSSALEEKYNIKTRKPYTITKQRERWTDEEHNSFLEALKLYGRAWQRIEEHIGTKTAVQIRSHAQKFFTKLEKEAAAKGIPIGQALDMEIPPPRPKRKPNYPYPRKPDPKTHTLLPQKDDTQTALASSLHSLDLERKPLPAKSKTNHKEKVDDRKTSDETQNGTTEDPQEASSLEKENSRPNESYITFETRKHQELYHDGFKNTDISSNISLSGSSHPSHENIVHAPYSDNPGNMITDVQGVRACPRHVPVQVVDVNEGYEHPIPNLSVNIPEASATSGYHNSATFHPLFNHFSDNQESHRSFLHFSSTISSLIVSSLLQNPAAHAAASFAAKYCHPVTTEAFSADSFSKNQLNDATTAPSVAAIAAATVAAATAWWSTHGLLPVCTPFYQGVYRSTSGTPIDGNLVNCGRDKAPSEGVLQEKKMDVDKTESAADLSSSEDSEKKLISEASPVDTSEPVPVVDSSKLTNLGKQVDRSSCGSNTTSSSDIETDALEKHAKEMEEDKVSDVKESNSRRGRSTITPNESWKEVSEEGRLAFQALFSREVLPQSFSDTRAISKKYQQHMVNNSELDLNRLSQEPCESNGNGLAVLRGEEGSLRIGLGSVKLNHRHTGFKPYKRCSIEAKENNKIVSAAAAAGDQNDEKGPKRMRLATGASA